MVATTRNQGTFVPALLKVDPSVIATHTRRASKTHARARRVKLREDEVTGEDRVEKLVLNGQASEVIPGLGQGKENRGQLAKARETRSRYGYAVASRIIFFSWSPPPLCPRCDDSFILFFFMAAALFVSGFFFLFAFFSGPFALRLRTPRRRERKRTQEIQVGPSGEAATEAQAADVLIPRLVHTGDRRPLFLFSS